MIQFEELSLELASQEEPLNNLAQALYLEDKKEKIKALEAQTMQDGFWDNQELSKKVLKEMNMLKHTLEQYEVLHQKFEDTQLMLDLAVEEADASLLPELEAAVHSIASDIEALTLTTLLSGEYDHSNAILTFHAGAGGTEAQDWAEMLLRMYTRWGERHHFKVSVLDYLDGDEAGIKSATLLVEGKNAYGFLKSEMGVHRLVRISPFDSSGRRHTSFASLEVIPEIDDDVPVEINPDDLRIDTFRASGAGGQHVNKTSSAVRITHLPTGIVVSCQAGRSQHQNKDIAMLMLKSKLIEIKEREHLEKIEDIKGSQKEIAWGSQIRSYVFMPYTLAKDHRTNYEVGNIDAVMDGDLDGFINAYLKQEAGHKK